MKTSTKLLASMIFVAGALASTAKAQNSSATTPGLNSAPPAVNNQNFPSNNQVYPGNTANSPGLTAPAMPGNQQTLPQSATGQTIFPGSTSTGQLNSPTTDEVDRQREQLNQQRDRTRNSASCATLTDTTARANCEASARTN